MQIGRSTVILLTAHLVFLLLELHKYVLINQLQDQKALLMQEYDRSVVQHKELYTQFEAITAHNNVFKYVTKELHMQPVERGQIYRLSIDT